MINGNSTAKASRVGQVVKLAYETPRISGHGDVRILTQSGTNITSEPGGVAGARMPAA